MPKQYSKWRLGGLPYGSVFLGFFLGNAFSGGGSENALACSGSKYSARDTVEFVFFQLDRVGFGGLLSGLILLRFCFFGHVHHLIFLVAILSL
jgi:hypothetical protein